jgi:hypothetical protein
VKRTWVGLVLVGALAILAAAWLARGVPSPIKGGGIWSHSCVSGDDGYLAVAGDHSALLDLNDGHELERLLKAGDAVACSGASAIVIGGGHAWALPGKTEVTPAPEFRGELVAVSPVGEWVGSSAEGIFVGARKLDLSPARFKAPPEGFEVRAGNLIEDGRLVVAATWKPAVAPEPGSVHPEPSRGSAAWGLFAIDLRTSEPTPLTLPLEATAQLPERIAATPDGMHLATASFDGKQLTVAMFDQGAKQATKQVTHAARAGLTTLAISDDGAWIAAGTASPGLAWVVDPSGNTIWSGELPQGVIGLHFLGDDSLIVTAANAQARRVKLPTGTELWRSR